MSEIGLKSDRNGSESGESPRVEWRGLKIGGGNLIHKKVVFISSDVSRFGWESLAII